MVKNILKYPYRLLKHWNALFQIRIKYLDSSISPRVSLSIESFSFLKLGHEVVISDFTTLHVRNFDVNINNSFLEIGDQTFIGEFNNIRAGGGFIKIGRKCLISQHITIVASNHEYVKGIDIMDQAWDTRKNNITIEDDVWIGSHCVILPGVTIGKGAIIGAGSIVTRDVKPNSIVVGNPAKHVKFRK